MTTPRTAIPDFQLANPIYALASVTFYTVDDDGAATTTLATLYTGRTGSTTASNPQSLDADGKFSAPVYISEPVIAEAEGPNVASHTTGVIGILESARGIYAVDYIPSSLLAAIAAGTSTTDVITYITAALAAMPAKGGRFYFPDGKIRCSTKIVLSKPGVYSGGGAGGSTASNSSTIIEGSSTSDPVISITSSTGGVTLEDLGVTSTVAAASRTGAGVEVNAGPNVLIRRVYSTGHLYGFLTESPGVKFDLTNASLNFSHGYHFDGTVAAQNQIRLHETEASSNGGDGFRVTGHATGIQANHIVSSGNTGVGFRAIFGTSFVNDIYFTEPEISANGGTGIHIGDNNGGTGLTVSGGLVEASAIGIWIGTGFTRSTITGVTIECPTAIFANGDNVTINGNIPTNCTTAGIELGPTSTGVTLTGNKVANQGATSAVGLYIDGGAAAFTASGNDWSSATSARTGTIPAGSYYVNNKGDNSVLAGTTTFTALQAGTGAASGNNLVAVNIGSATARWQSWQNSLGEALYGIDSSGIATFFLNSGTGGAILGTGTNSPCDSYTNNLRRLRIDGAGNVVPGTAALATNATDGFTYIQTCAGPPTGTPTSYVGRVAIVYDTTNHKLYVYDGGWKGGTAPGAWS